MSDHWIGFLPQDPRTQPTREAADKAHRLLRSFMPDDDDVSVEFWTDTQFVHPGANWSGVRCSSCGEGVEDWWGDTVGAVSEQSFTDLAVTTPCCGATTSLNLLDYVWPAGFARFVIEAMNPGAADTTAKQDAQLERCLRMPLRKILAHL